MDFITKFQKIKKKFDKIDPSALKENIAVQVNIVDEDCGGAFYISNISDTFSVEPYDYHDYTAMITASAAEFEKIIGRKIETEKAIESGKITVDGNVGHIKAIAELFPKSEKKPTAKKCTSKCEKKCDKPEEKKAETAKKTAEKKTTKKK